MHSARKTTIAISVFALGMAVFTFLACLKSPVPGVLFIMALFAAVTGFCAFGVFVLPDHWYRVAERSARRRELRLQREQSERDCDHTA